MRDEVGYRDAQWVRVFNCCNCLSRCGNLTEAASQNTLKGNKQAHKRSIDADYAASVKDRNKNDVGNLLSFFFY